MVGLERLAPALPDTAVKERDVETPSMVLTAALVLFLGAAAMAVASAELPQGGGLAARYPGDSGIERDPAVVLAEDFSGGHLESLKSKWTDVNNREGKALALSDLAPPGSASRHSLRVTATRGENEGGAVFTVLKPGHDQLFMRFYVRFAPDYGFDHHFSGLGGAIDPPPWPTGGAGIRPTTSWGTGIEPTAQSQNSYPPVEYPPPGIWHFYTYWPEMRSWQNEDGTGDSFYGNNFEPETPVIVPRGEWICVEIMVKMNSSPEKRDGEQALWIDGRLVGHFAPGSMSGYWIRDEFRRSEERGGPFEGFRWRTDMRTTINKVKLENYVTERAFSNSDAYAAEHPDFPINTQQATVWFSNLVVSTQYIGPLRAVARRMESKER